MADFSVNDRRASRRPNLIVGQSVSEAKEIVRRQGGRLPNEGAVYPAVGDTNPLARFSPQNGDATLHEMRMNRRIARRKQAAGMGQADLSFATMRPRDPMFYWRQNNIPWDVNKDDELVKIRNFCRILYLTHPIIASCIDIFTKFPIQGMELDCKDEQLTDFYGTLFFDELDYKRYLIDVGREYWLTGEAWPLGAFNETLGVWEDDELLNPDDVRVEKSALLKDPRYLIALPESLRQVLTTQAPRWEYEALTKMYPELVNYARQDARMPVSNMLLKQLKFTGDTFHNRGIPILMRAFRAIVQEEKLNAAMDAIADRLYTPLILAKLGASATDLGTTQPWIPTAGDLDAFEEALDAAFAADFRVLTHHFGIDMAPVFGRENVPDMTADFDRLEDRILMTFGLSRTMLQGADCLAGDTVVSVRRAGKTFPMTIEKLARRCAGLPMPGREWDPEIPTYIARADGEFVRLGALSTAWFSGVKEVFELTTESGRSIRASAKHPFLTPSGEFVQLGDLQVGDEVQVNIGRRQGTGNHKRNHYRQVKVRFHPYQSSDGKSGKFKIPVHRAVMEAALNQVSYQEFLHVMRTDEIRAKEFFYIDPTEFVVHHEDENHLNNDLSNLSLMKRRDHYAHHGGEHMGQVLERIGSEKIVSIVSRGQQPTFDLGMADDPHNFLANDFVVHNSGETYAADALNRDIVSQLLTSYQDLLRELYRDRALIVAEAQEHFDYDVRNGQRYVKMEEVLEVDPESGEATIVEQPALLIPDLKFDTMNLRDQQVERDFQEQLNATGVPVPYRARLAGTAIGSLEDAIEERRSEQVALAIAEQETRREIFVALRDKGLPIPEDLSADFQARAQTPGQGVPNGTAGDMPVDTLGMNPVPTPALAPTEEDLAQDGTDDQMAQNPALGTPPGAVVLMPQNGQRPPESDEQRAGMPKPANARYANYRVNQMPLIVAEHYEAPDNSQEVNGNGEPIFEHYRPTGRFGNPKHVGMRRYAQVRQVIDEKPPEEEKSA